MVDVNDTNSSRKRLDKEWDNLAEADIDDRDRTAVRRFVEHRRDSEERAVTTLINDLSNLRRASERASVSLVDMDRSDVGGLLSVLTAHEAEGGYGLDPDGSGMFGYKRVLRIFFRWLDGQPGRDAYPFHDSIELPSRDVGTVDEEYNLTEDEIAALKRHAERDRDRALIDFLADVCGRVSLVTQLRYGDVYDIDTDRPHYRPNDEAINHKRAPLKRYPIVDSRAELRVWMQRYHRDPRDEAPLFHLLDGHYDRERPGECAVSGDRVRAMLRECAERAVAAGSLEDIDPARVHPHNFRHTGLTRLSKTDHTPQEIAHIAGLVDDKMRMVSYYDHTADVERNEQVFDRAGYIDDPGEGLDTPDTARQACGNCGERLQSSERFCPRCGAAADESAGERVNGLADRSTERVVDEADADRRAVLLKIAETADVDPERLAALLE